MVEGHLARNDGGGMRPRGQPRGQVEGVGGGDVPWRRRGLARCDCGRQRGAAFCARAGVCGRTTGSCVAAGTSLRGSITFSSHVGQQGQRSPVRAWVGQGGVMLFPARTLISEKEGGKQGHRSVIVIRRDAWRAARGPQIAHRPDACVQPPFFRAYVGGSGPSDAVLLLLCAQEEQKGEARPETARRRTASRKPV